MEILVITFIAGIICFLIPKRFHILSGMTAFFAGAASLFFSLKLFITKQPLGGLFKLDSLNFFIVPFICFFGFLVILYSIGSIKKQLFSSSEYFAYLLLTLCVSCAAVMANNIILFLILWGIGALLLYLLIGIQGSDGAALAAKKTFVIVGGSDIIMLFGAAILWHITGSFDMDKMHVIVSSPAGAAAFIAIMIAALSKAGAMPFHSWIPDASRFAAMPVMAFLPASLDKLLGIYLLARCTLNIFQLQQNSFLSLLLMLIGAGTIICAVMMALVQHNIRKLLAYHAVSQVGYMVLGIATALPIGIAGGLFHMLNHAIYKSCLFLTAGNVEHKTGESELDKLGGLAVVMPITFISCLIAALSISGIPPLNGFFSKWMIYQGLIQSFGNSTSRFTVLLCLIAAMFGSALTLASFMKLLHAVFLGQASRQDQAQKRNEAPWPMLVVVSFLSLLCVVFGIFAYVLPLKYFIYPAVNGVTMIGNYAPRLSVFLIAIGVLLGLVIYVLSRRIRAVKADISFVGGENISGDTRVSGVDFYNTISDLGFFRFIYMKAESGFFDIYEQGKNVIVRTGRFFRYLHNGVLPTYLVWTLLGMMVLFFIMLR